MRKSIIASKRHSTGTTELKLSLNTSGADKQNRHLEFHDRKNSILSNFMSNAKVGAVWIVRLYLEIIYEL